MENAVVVDSDPAWPQIAAGLITELRVALSTTVDHLEHVGSTSVPGLAAKPVIDLMAPTTDLDQVVRLEREALVPLGYTPRKIGMTGRLCYRRDAGTAPAVTVAVHLHVVPSDSWPTQNERVLRDQSDHGPAGLYPRQDGPDPGTR